MNCSLFLWRNTKNFFFKISENKVYQGNDGRALQYVEKIDGPLVHFCRFKLQQFMGGLTDKLYRRSVNGAWYFWPEKHFRTVCKNNFLDIFLSQASVDKHYNTNKYVFFIPRVSISHNLCSNSSTL